MKTKHLPLAPRYRALAARLARAGLLLQGTITRRTILQGDPVAPGRPKTYGPYYQWTFKRQGKTITVNLTASQAKAYQRAIDNQREADRVLRQMRELSLQILESTTVGVKKRKRL